MALIMNGGSEEQVAAVLESIIENIPDMIFMKDAKDLRFVLFNRAGEQMIGRSREEMLGKSDRDFFPKEQAEFFIAKDREVLESGKTLDIPEEPMTDNSGKVRTLHTQKVPIMDADGKPIYLLGISEDITESIEYRRLKETQKELENALRIIVSRESKMSQLKKEIGKLKDRYDSDAHPV